MREDRVKPVLSRVLKTSRRGRGRENDQVVGDPKAPETVTDEPQAIVDAGAFDQATEHRKQDCLTGLEYPIDQEMDANTGGKRAKCDTECTTG